MVSLTVSNPGLALNSLEAETFLWMCGKSNLLSEVQEILGDYQRC